MRRYATILAAVLLTGFQTPPPSLPPQLAALAEDAQAARTFDYMALKAEGADLRSLSDAVHVRTASANGSRRCLTEPELILVTELVGATSAPDQATLDADRAATDAAWTRWLAFGETVMTGAPIAEPPYSHVAEMAAKAEAESDPRVRELLRRAARDQVIRRGWEVGAEVWGQTPPSPGTRARFEARLSQQMCETDGDNTAWLKADLAANGWYRRSVFGDVPSRSAWLMIQHADRDPAFQREMLSLLEPLAAEKEVEPWDVALLFDRVAVNAGRPQRYGSQGRCVARNVWGPQTLEDEARVDEFRASMELPPLADYAGHMNRYCADFTG